LRCSRRCLLEAPFLFLGFGLQRRHLHRLAVFIHRHHGEITAVGMPHQALLYVLGDDLDADFHRR